MVSRTISAENLGPISELGFSLDAPGVTVLVAPNGSGKTILLDAVQAAAKGEGKLPLRDRTKRGKVEAFGATITIGGTCRHTGEFEVTNLEGRFDLAALVDPRIKTPALADAARIKALVSLTGVSAAIDLFRKHEAFENFDRVVRAASTTPDDLVEMARRIKADYDEAARTAEDEAERETGHADGLKPAEGLNLKEDHDSVKLQCAYDNARDAVTRILAKAEQAAALESQREKAAKQIAKLKNIGPVEQKTKLLTQREEYFAAITTNNQELDSLRERARELEAKNASFQKLIESHDAMLRDVQLQIESLNEAQATYALDLLQAPTEEEIEAARLAVFEASKRVEQGALIRQALKDQEKAATHRKAAAASRMKAAKYRDAGRATDEVLSNCIKCPQLRVESDGKSARLVADTERGKSITYHDLSDGEKWTLAIDIGADQVGEGGLLVISQIGWEGIDGKNRQIIHQRAVERGVYILTAEAATNPEASRTIKPMHFGDAELAQDSGATVLLSESDKEHIKRMRKAEREMLFEKFPDMKAQLEPKDEVTAG